MKHVSVIPNFDSFDFIMGVIILLSISLIYFYINAKKHRKKYDEMRVLALQKVNDGEVDPEKVKDFLKVAKAKIHTNRYLLIIILFLDLALMVYLIGGFSVISDF